jgi:hypothetical protein
MISAPWDRRSPRPVYAQTNVTAVRPRYQAATRVPCHEGGPSPTRIAGSSRPTVTFRALLFSAMLSVAAPRPRTARYSAETAFGKAGHAGENQRPDHDLRDVMACAELGRRQLHRDAGADHDGRGEHGDAHIERSRPGWMDRQLELLLLLQDGL